MKEYKTIALVLILGGICILLFSLQSKLVGSGYIVAEWMQIGGACFGIFVTIIGIYILIKVKN
jgi:hypothetical protein